MKLILTVFCVTFLCFVEAKFFCTSRIPAEKRFVKASIAVKALVTKTFHNLTEIWILDVYKGEDKLAAGLGLPGHGADAVFHLKDQ